MKKILAVIMTVVMLFGFTGCSSEPTKIPITIDNVEDYFDSEVTIHNVNYNVYGDKKYFEGTAFVTVEIEKVVDCSIEGFSFNLGLYSWDEEKWESYEDLDIVTIPENGRYSKTFEVETSVGAPFDWIYEPGYSVRWDDLQGNVVVEKGQELRLPIKDYESDKFIKGVATVNSFECNPRKDGKFDGIANVTVEIEEIYANDFDCTVELHLMSTNGYWYNDFEEPLDVIEFKPNVSYKNTFDIKTMEYGSPDDSEPEFVVTTTIVKGEKVVVA